ncbi:hypothetical protein T05_7520 [Trichinella murrelli]|uniref:Uncharacterized protein n=1 Tax=Trichinella murrelli TaxID=144512 RepID=A0A0V0UE18_9BILA|nr:hypothetical protein T05_7520 [Trichinella murrelli]
MTTIRDAYINRIDPSANKLTKMNFTNLQFYMLTYAITRKRSVILDNGYRQFVYDLGQIAVLFDSCQTFINSASGKAEVSNQIDQSNYVIGRRMTLSHFHMQQIEPEFKYHK